MTKILIVLSCLVAFTAAFPLIGSISHFPVISALLGKLNQIFQILNQRQAQPAILSSLYGYDGCIGGVNNFDTDKQYMDELKRRNCSVITGPDGNEYSNVADSRGLAFACGKPISWSDGMPVTFNFPLVEQPAPESIQVELSDGSVITPDCVMEAPANEFNELDTLLVIGQLGDGPLDTSYPVRLTIVGDVRLQGPDGELNAQGISFANPGDMRYLGSSVRMVYARLWDVKQWSEGDSYPGSPQPSGFYPNNCESLFSKTSHVVRVAFSGGITLDGVTGVQPDTPGVFSVWDAETYQEIPYLGLADLGNSMSGMEGEMYAQDGDNYLDICLDMPRAHLPSELGVSLNCDLEQGSVLYPPKGRPYGCQPDDIVLTKNQAFGNFTMAWVTGGHH